MRLLILTPQLPYPPRQGTTIRNFNLIKTLSARHAVDLFTFLAPGERLEADNPLNDLCGRIECLAQPIRTTAQRARDTLLSSRPDMALRLESEPMHTLVRTWTTVNPPRYDIVQIEGIELSQYGMQLARQSAKTIERPLVIFDDHNCEYLLQQRNAFTDLRQPRRWIAAAYSLIQWQKLRRYEWASLQAANATIAVSQADKMALLALDPAADITVVSNGVDLDEYAIQTTQPDLGVPKLVFTGKMDYRPNIDAVLWFSREVLPMILAAEPKVCFQIVGMNPHPRLDELRDNPQVEITGAVVDTRPFIQAAAVYVIPMRIGGGTRFKALEAMASASAIVSTTLGVEGIPVENGREMLIADAPTDFAAATLRLIADARLGRTLGKELGSNGRRFVEARYAWSSIVPRLEDVYSRAGAAPPKPR